MGKASRTKRERREGGDDLATKAAAARAAKRRPFPVFWTVLALIALGGIAALVVTSQQEDTPELAAAKDARVFSDITVTGAKLADFPGSSSDDPAVGKPLPTIAGTGFDDEQRTIGAKDGVARVIVVVAHWCPHCQREVPRIVDWAKEGKLPDGVEVTTIATASSDSQANYPPAAWLAQEDWPFDTIADDETGSAAEALGLDGYPFMVFVNADGTVAKRTSGELPIDDFDANVEALVTKPA